MKNLNELSTAIGQITRDNIAALPVDQLRRLEQAARYLADSCRDELERHGAPAGGAWCADELVWGAGQPIDVVGNLTLSEIIRNHRRYVAWLKRQK